MIMYTYMFSKIGVEFRLGLKNSCAVVIFFLSNDDNVLAGRRERNSRNCPEIPTTFVCAQGFAIYLFPFRVTHGNMRRRPISIQKRCN